MKEEKDAVRKLEAAEKLVEHSRNLEEKYLQARGSGKSEKVDEWLLKEMAVVSAIFQAISAEINDIEQKLPNLSSCQSSKRRYLTEKGHFSHIICRQKMG